MGEAVATTGDGLTRNVGFFGLLLTSEGSIIGSGWLFGALFAATIGGPAAIIAWLIGSVIVILLALVHAELGGMFPVSGGTTRFPYYAFGGLAGASFGWFSWLQAVGTAPIEVEAAIQYSSNYVHGLTHTVNGTVVLTGLGYLVAVGLMALFVAINLFGVRFLVRANSAITTWKVIIPTFTIFVMFFTHFDTSNFTSAGSFAPYGLRGVLTAVSAGGAEFALVGFEQAVQLGGESKNPQRDMPRAVIFSMLLGATIYILLQVVFIGALPHGALAHGWHHVSFTGIFGPFAGLAKHLGLAWLAYILYVDAIVAPVGSGLIYTTTTSRITFGMSKNGNVPSIFERTTKKTNVPVFGLIFTFLMGLLLFLPFPGWQSLVGFITSATVLMYAGAPLALGALRLQKPDAERPYRLPWRSVLAPISFVTASLII
jgi:amino acid transporter